MTKHLTFRVLLTIAVVAFYAYGMATQPARVAEKAAICAANPGLAFYCSDIHAAAIRTQMKG